MRKSLSLKRTSFFAITLATLSTACSVCLGQSSGIEGVPGESIHPQTTADTPERSGSNSSTCVPAMTNYPAFQNTYGNPYRIMDCRNGDCNTTVIDRWKRSMQASHWGYPEYFHRNSYGQANRQAFSNNIRDGAIERSTLYLMDFYPEDSPYAQMLTPKGLERLDKSICVSNALASPLRIEKSARPELNELRRQWLSEHPLVTAAGIGLSEIQMVSKPIGIQAAEGIYRYQRGLMGPSNPNSGASSNANSAPMFPGTGASSSTQNIR
jgi:hypothetical protein